MAATSDVLEEKGGLEQHGVSATSDGQERYNEAQRCQSVAPTDDTDA